MAILLSSQAKLSLSSQHRHVSSKINNHDSSSLTSTWAHRAYVASGCATVGLSLYRHFIGGSHQPYWLVGPAMGYVLADLGTGVYHWGIDNYGDPTIPFVGPQIERAQGHHVWPKTIARRHVANNLHAAALGVAALVFPLDLMVDDPGFHGFVSVFAGCVMLSQQFHAWAHAGPAGVPPPVAALQRLGFLLSAKRHAVHHRRPVGPGSSGGGYCIVNGMWNGILDDYMVFRSIEMFLFVRFGVRPKCWDEHENHEIELEI